jgi:hypothetical protein
MPYLLLKRSDIPAGVLQTLDLQPNTLIREEAYRPVGQTGYRIPPPVATVALTNAAGTITFTNQAEGLAAWFLTNVDDGGSAAASLPVTFLPANPAPGDTIDIDATAIGGPPLVTFTFVIGPPGGPTDVTIGIDQNATALAFIAVLTAYVPLQPFVTAVPGAPGDVIITAVQVGTAGNTVFVIPTGNFVPVGPNPLAGGADANSLTQDVLGLMNYGVAAAATAMNLAAINGALTTGTIVAGDVASILDILAGRQYLVPAGVQIETGAAFSVVPAVGATGGPNWDVDQGFRRIYQSGALRISFGEGRLSLWTDNAYTLNGTAGAAVAVYNDDGTLYTGA